jgi:thioredoxin reductase (NADPH)
MLAQLLCLREELGGEAVFAVDIIDIDADPALEALYDELVPVLSGGGQELCHYHLNPDSVRAYLAEIR